MKAMKYIKETHDFSNYKNSIELERFEEHNSIGQQSLVQSL